MHPPFTHLPEKRGREKLGWTEAKNVPVSTAAAACMLPPPANASSSYVLDSCRGGGGRKEGGRKRKLLGIRSAIATASDFRAPLRKGGRNRVRNEAGGRGWALPAWPSSPDVPAVRDFFFEAANHPQSSHLRFLARILRRVQVIVVALLETVPF